MVPRIYHARITRRYSRACQAEWAGIWSTHSSAGWSPFGWPENRPAEPDPDNAGEGNRRMRVVLTIGGLDPSGCSGVGADLRTLAALGVHGACAITAITAQNSVAWHGQREVDSATLAAQLDAVFADARAVA